MAIEDYGPRVNGTGWALCCLAIILVSARCYCRHFVLNNFSWDDAWMVVAMCAGIVMVVLVSISIHYGFGRHMDTITNPYDKEQVIKFTLVPAGVSIVASTLGKLSVVLFLFRLLAQTNSKAYRWFLWSITGAMIILNIFAVAAIWGKCIPLEKVWRPETPGWCAGPGTMTIGGRIQSIYNAFMDVVTAVFPAYMLHKMQMKKSTKWGLSIVMGGGVLAAAATIVKVAYFNNTVNFADLSYAWGPLAIWYMVEVFVLIIAGTIPTLKPLVNMVRGKGLLTTNKNTSSGYTRNTSNSGWPKLSNRGDDKHNRPGDITVALDDIDNIHVRNDRRSTSTEAILS